MWLYTYSPHPPSLTTTLLEILALGCEKVACDLGLSDGLCQVLHFLNHQQLASNDWIATQQEKWR